MALIGVYFLSLISNDFKKLIPGFLSKLPFIIAPTVFINLYLKNMEPYYTFFFLILFTIMAFLFRTKRGFLFYMVVYSIGMALVLFLVKDSMLHKTMVGYYFASIAAIVWVVNSSFIWTQERLGIELNRVEKLNYLNSHKLRGHVARIIGLNHLVKIGEIEAKSMIDDEINSMEIELRKIQHVINAPRQIRLGKLDIKRRISAYSYRLKKDITFLDVGLTIIELVIIINIGIKYNHYFIS